MSTDYITAFQDVDYSLEYSPSSWYPTLLCDKASEIIFGEANIIIGFTDDGFVDENSTITCQDIPSIPMSSTDEFVMSAETGDMNLHERTHNILTRDGGTNILVSACAYGNKYMAFCIDSCLLCVKGPSQSVYVASRFIRKVYKDLGDVGIAVDIPNFNKNDVFYNLPVPSKLEQLCRDTYMKNIKHAVSTSHTPLANNGFNKYVLTNIVVSVSLIPSVIRTVSRHGATTQHGRMRLHVKVHYIQ